MARNIKIPLMLPFFEIKDDWAAPIRESGRFADWKVDARDIAREIDETLEVSSSWQTCHNYMISVYYDGQRMVLRTPLDCSDIPYALHEQKVLKRLEGVPGIPQAAKFFNSRESYNPQLLVATLRTYFNGDRYNFSDWRRYRELFRLATDMHQKGAALPHDVTQNIVDTGQLYLVDLEMVPLYEGRAPLKRRFMDYRFLAHRFRLASRF